MSGRPPLTVAELTALVGGALARESELEDVMVEGEVSNLSLPASGHVYFTLKDHQASLRCVCFRREAQRIPFQPENGMTVISHGHVGVFESAGQYQLYVDRLEPAGVGALALAVEQRRRRLAAEGLFDEARRRPLPHLPRRVAVITSPTGAALRDVVSILAQRAPAVDIVVVSAMVQGDGAGATIVRALERAQRLPGVEVVLLVRGGGTFEDLLAFSDEAVVRAVAACVLPVVSGVGHETDLTLVDWAADRRAATPSNAAELAVPDQRALRVAMVRRGARLGSAIREGIARKRAEAARATLRLAQQSPLRRLSDRRQQLDARSGELRAALLAELHIKERGLATARSNLRLQSPEQRLPVVREALRGRAHRLGVARATAIATYRSRLDRTTARLEALSPRRIINRGYSITVDAATGRLVTSAVQVRDGQSLRTRLASGEVRSTVTGIADGSADDAS